MKQSLLISNGKVVTPGRIIPAGAVYIENGIIQYVGKQGEHGFLDARNHIDAEGGDILPGFIDVHSDARQQPARLQQNINVIRLFFPVI